MGGWRDVGVYRGLCVGGGGVVGPVVGSARMRGTAAV